MKEGWSYKKLGEVCEVTDYVANGSFATLKQNVTYYNEPNYAILVRLADYSSNFDKDKFVYVDEHSYKFLSKSSLYGGEIIMSNVGSIGKCFLCPTLGEYMTIGPNSLLIRTPNNLFYLYYFKSNIFQKELMSITNSTTLSKFNKTQLKTLYIPVPPLSEQRSIVTRLDAAFSHIDALKANAEKQLNEARKLFQAELTECMKPKEGWEEKTLPKLSENLDSIRKPVTKKDRTEGIYPYYGASGIVDYVDNYLFDEDLLCISEDGANLLMRTYPIAFPISGKAWVNNHAHVLRFKCMSTQRYVEYYFAGLKLDEYITGAAQPKLTQKALNSIIISIPSSLAEQSSIVSHLNSLSSNIRKLEELQQKTIAECDALKQAMLREVFE